MATHSSTLAWEIPWTEEPGGLQSMGRTESDTTEALSISREMGSSALFRSCFSRQHFLHSTRPAANASLLRRAARRDQACLPALSLRNQQGVSTGTWHIPVRYDDGRIWEFPRGLGWG